MRRYEIMFILHPSSSEAEIEQFSGQMEEVVTTFRGEVHKIDQLGKKKLAYSIEKLKEGYYLLFDINGTGECIKEFERRLKVTDRVLRYLTVRVDEDLKRAEKLKSIRVKKKARRPSSVTESEATAPAL